MRPSKLLFFAYAFPPCRAIGAVRCWNMAKHLARRGWEVEVVTINPGCLAEPETGLKIEQACEAEKIRLRFTPCAGRFLSGGWLKLKWWQPRLLAGIARRVAEFAGVDPTRAWVQAAQRACDSLRPGEVDAVFASAPPYTAFDAAANVARRLRAPLILDYRDLWSQNPHYGKFAKEKIRRHEAALLALARGATAVAPSMAECLRLGFDPGVPVSVVTNGFDAEEFAGVAPGSFDDFAVVYAGRFYPPARSAEPLISAVTQANQLRTGGRPIRLHYFGPDCRHLEMLSAAYGAQAWVKNHGNVARSQVLAALKGADIAAVITTVEAGATLAERGILTGKLFEAIGAGAPVLLISPHDSDAWRLVTEHGLGEAFAGTDSVSMARHLARQASALAANRLARAGEMFSWPRLAEKLDVFLRQAAL